jgi:hypothetical protein
MQAVRNLLRGGLAVALVSLAVAPVGATTLIRQDLERLVASNATIVVGEVLDTSSYWNGDGTFILTDVRIAPREVLKGDGKGRELTVTIMGGTVLDLTTLIVGGAELIPGKAYVLFLDEGDLPGAKGVRTVRHHSQGVFEIVPAQDGIRAISQASRQPLAPDAKGNVEAPGGARGIPLDTLRQSIRELVRNSRDIRPEVKR